MEHEKSSLSSNYIEHYTYKRWESMIRVRDEEEDRVLKNDQLQKGPWTPEEDSKLTSAIATHGVGRWNTLAFLAGLRRSGKSCRLRWLNYLHPDLRRGTFTLQEQLRVLELHFRWGNRWSKIAEHLPGRTDNEIKNYWRTKVQKLARQFHCQVNSPQFRYALRNNWIPRLVEQIQADATATSNSTKAQIQSPTPDCGHGLFGGYSSSTTTSSDNYCCLFDYSSPTTRALDPLDQHINGPADKQYSKPDVSTDSSSAHISTESGSPNELDQNWEQISEFTLNDEDYMFIWEFLHD